MKYQAVLKETETYKDQGQEYEQKMGDINPNSQRANGMANSAWRESGKINRHVVTYHATHQFHHIIC